MADIIKASQQKLDVLDNVARSGDRRTFLKWAGATVALFTVAGAAGCSDDDTTTNPGTGATLTNDDFGVLNYAYALEQLEAAFYTKVVASTGTGLSADEMKIMTDIRDHEIAHRDFFKAALTTKAIGSLEVDFSSIDFTKRDQILAAAKTFEDLGVSAYNGAGKLLQDANFLLIAGKIVSVEARHAATIRDLINPKNAGIGFAGDDVVDAMGLDMAKNPSVVLAAAKTYIKTSITNNLP